MSKAAIKIQSFWRMCAAKMEAKRLKEKDQLALKNKSAICIQVRISSYIVFIIVVLIVS